MCIKKKLFCIGVQLIHNVVTVLGEQLKGLNHVYTCIGSPPNSPPIQAATRIYMLDLHVRSLLVIHLKYSSVSLSSVTYQLWDLRQVV